MTLNLKLQCQGLVNVIILMHTYLLREQQQLLEQEMMLLQDKQMKEIKV